MTELRWFGLLSGIAALLYIFNRFRYGKVRRVDFAIGAFLSLGLITVSADPGSVNLIRDMLALEREQFSRLIALLIVSNLLIWVLLLYTRVRWSSRADQFDRLVRQLGVDQFDASYPGLSLSPLAVVIPAFNEESNIAQVLAQMPTQVCGRPLSVIVIDDGSVDGTAEMARAQGALTVRSPINRGGGAALRLGFDIVRLHGVEIVVTMDADGQHLPAEIERLVAPILEDQADFVIGSRILGKRERDSLVRYVGIRFFNGIIRLLTTVRITDCSNGFRAFRVKQLSQVLLQQDQFHTSELIIDAGRRGIRIGEAPVTVRKRLSGVSKKGAHVTYGLSFARTIIKSWWR